VKTDTEYQGCTYTLERSTLNGVRAWHYEIRDPNDARWFATGDHTGVREQVIREIEHRIREHLGRDPRITDEDVALSEVALAAPRSV
jgi:hypothetical protein